MTTKTQTPTKSTKPAYIAYHVRNNKDEQGEGFLARIGVLFPHADGNSSLVQNPIPVYKKMAQLCTRDLCGYFLQQRGHATRTHTVRFRIASAALLADETLCRRSPRSVPSANPVRLSGTVAVHACSLAARMA